VTTATTATMTTGDETKFVKAYDQEEPSKDCQCSLEVASRCSFGQQFDIDEGNNNSNNKGPRGLFQNKGIIKISPRHHEHTSQCDGLAWLTSEWGAGFPNLVDGESLPPTPR
jgi:hypothetical protein